MPLGRDAQLFEVTAVIKREADIDAVHREIDRTIEQFQTRPVDPGQVPRVKRPRKIRPADGDGLARRRGRALAPFVGVTGGIEALDRLYAEADQVTPEDVMQAARKYFNSNHRTVVVLKGTQQ